MTIIRDDQRTPSTRHLLLELELLLELLLAALLLLHLLQAALPFFFLQPFPMLDGENVSDGIPGRRRAGVVTCVEIKILRRVRVAFSTPSTRCLLDGVAMLVPPRSTEPARPRQRRHTG